MTAPSALRSTTKGKSVPEEDGEYEAYMTYLYERDIAPVLSRSHPGWHALEWYGKYGYRLDRLTEAHATVRLVVASSDPYETFRPKALGSVIRDTSLGVRATLAMLSDLGFAETLDSEYLVLV